MFSPDGRYCAFHRAGSVEIFDFHDPAWPGRPKKLGEFVRGRNTVVRLSGKVLLGLDSAIAGQSSDGLYAFSSVILSEFAE
jgi:hypothetical protein